MKRGEVLKYSQIRAARSLVFALDELCHGFGWLPASVLFGEDFHGFDCPPLMKPRQSNVAYV